jgi:hypothetical protein
LEICASLPQGAPRIALSLSKRQANKEDCMLNRTGILLGLVAFMLATAPGIHAQQTNRAADRYTFRAGDEKQPLELVISRWSTDAERDSVFQSVQKDPAKTMDALKEPGTVGWIHLPGGLDHTIRYAKRVMRPDGSVDIVALAEGAVWIWWQPTAAAADRSKDYNFTAIQLHMARSGVGEGKLSSSKVAADKDAGIAIGDYAQEPALLTEVKRDPAARAS